MHHAVLLRCCQVTVQGVDALEQQNLDLAAEVARVEALNAEVRVLQMESMLLAHVSVAQADSVMHQHELLV